MNARLTIALLAATAIVAMALGCGGGGSSSSSSAQGGTTETTQGVTASEPTGGDRQSFVAQANAACKREGKDLLTEANAYSEQHENEHVSVADTVRAVFLPIVEAQIAAVKGLEAPAGDEKQIDAMLAAQQAAAQEVGKQEDLRSFPEVESYFSAAAKKLRAYGLSGCAFG